MDKELTKTSHIVESLDCVEDLLMSTDDLQQQIHETQSNQARFIIAFDATGSMASFWSQAERSLGKVIEEINSKCGGKALVQMVAYRDDGDKPKDLEYSQFSNNESELKSFISRQRCFGGDDYEEAVDTCLKHCIKENPSRTILLGDAPAHTNIQGRDGYIQARQLKQLNSPVFTLRCTTQQDLKENFIKIAELSGGKSFNLNHISDMVDIIATIIAADKKLLKATAGQLPYLPKTEAAKQIAKEL